MWQGQGGIHVGLSEACQPTSGAFTCLPGGKAAISSATVCPHHLWDRPNVAPKELEVRWGTDSERM